ncbi:phospholipase D family protein [Marinobacter sp. S6332]|uniref:phospholipase D family protein n=1 Tax=Marinobacter sp. S6332 TaxID=2926403 RepID=UPI001FF506C2|nr:phospholipase D family protein [Marinobacter sp. S6332]MCK0164663.1 phospholipase D family protein [Marinobacter sp. S6332]
MPDRIATVSRRALCAKTLCILFVILFMQGCAQLPPHNAPPLSYAFDRPDETRLGRQVQPHLPDQSGYSGFYIQDAGRQAFLQRAALIEAAEQSIDAQYYIWNSDVSGSYLARRLLVAADRGVRVRLLLDDVNLDGRDTLLAALDQHPNIEISIYNPFAIRSGIGKWLNFISDFQRLNQRMHNKTFVVDGALGIMGGRNIGDEYFDLHPQVNFRDRDVLIAGPVVADLTANFDAFWNSRSSYLMSQLEPDAAQELGLSTELEQIRAAASDGTGLTRVPPQDSASALEYISQILPALVWAEGELVFDSPTVYGQDVTDSPQRSAQALYQLVEEAGKEILVESAYLILGDDQLDILRQVKARGVRVLALTNSLASNDLTTNHAGYARRRGAMLANGLELYELRPDAEACLSWIAMPDFCRSGSVGLHAKSAVFDRKALYIGSFNINLRSIYLNSETVLVIHSAQLAERLAQDIEAAMTPENSWMVTREAGGQLFWSAGEEQFWTHEPATGFWRRFKSGLFSLLPMEKYL